MPLLLCPNDNGSMQTVQRSGVEFDICPTCRGVWLDRGELEKLLEASGEAAAIAPRTLAEPGRDSFNPGSSQRSDSRRDRDDYDDDDYRPKKRRPSIFDIFD